MTLDLETFLLFEAIQRERGCDRLRQCGGDGVCECDREWAEARAAADGGKG